MENKHENAWIVAGLEEAYESLPKVALPTIKIKIGDCYEFGFTAKTAIAFIRLIIINVRKHKIVLTNIVYQALFLTKDDELRTLWLNFKDIEINSEDFYIMLNNAESTPELYDATLRLRELLKEQDENTPLGNIIKLAKHYSEKTDTLLVKFVTISNGDVYSFSEKTEKEFKQAIMDSMFATPTFSATSEMVASYLGLTHLQFLSATNYKTDKYLDFTINDVPFIVEAINDNSGSLFLPEMVAEFAIAVFNRAETLTNIANTWGYLNLIYINRLESKEGDLLTKHYISGDDTAELTSRQHNRIARQLLEDSKYLFGSKISGPILAVVLNVSYSDLSGSIPEGVILTLGEVEPLVKSLLHNDWMDVDSAKNCFGILDQLFYTSSVRVDSDDFVEETLEEIPTRQDEKQAYTFMSGYNDVTGIMTVEDTKKYLNEILKSACNIRWMDEHELTTLVKFNNYTGIATIESFRYDHLIDTLIKDTLEQNILPNIIVLRLMLDLPFDDKVDELATTPSIVHELLAERCVSRSTFKDSDIYNRFKYKLPEFEKAYGDRSLLTHSLEETINNEYGDKIMSQTVKVEAELSKDGKLQTKYLAFENMTHTEASLYLGYTFEVIQAGDGNLLDENCYTIEVGGVGLAVNETIEHKFVKTLIDDTLKLETCGHTLILASICDVEEYQIKKAMEILSLDSITTCNDLHSVLKMILDSRSRRGKMVYKLLDNAECESDVLNSEAQAFNDRVEMMMGGKPYKNDLVMGIDMVAPTEDIDKDVLRRHKLMLEQEIRDINSKLGDEYFVNMFEEFVNNKLITRSGLKAIYKSLKDEME